ncbi:hypothetical protein VCRA2127O344_90073 [Vibrio crassostreae]|nr:hypothetical protein VCRA2127O344_90073 [Vibrio crassostreae]
MLLPVVNAIVCSLITTNDEKSEKLAIILSAGSLIYAQNLLRPLSKIQESHDHSHDLLILICYIIS